jgi:hypothetical protein
MFGVGVKQMQQIILVSVQKVHRCLGDKSSINGGIKYLKYCITIEKTTIYFLFSTHKEYIRSIVLFALSHT